MKGPEPNPRVPAQRAQRRYMGVSALKRVERYHAVVSHGNRDSYAGSWPTARLAAIARDRLVLHLGLEKRLNFPERSRKLGPATADGLRREARILSKKRARTHSPYFGVCWEARRRRWSAQVRTTKQVVVGYFKDPKAAAEVRDRVVLYLRRNDERFRKAPLNFPNKALRPLSPADARVMAMRLRKRRTTSRFVGVYRDASKPGRPWAFRFERPSALLRYRTEHQAAIARDRALLFYFGTASALRFPEAAARLGAANIDTLRKEALRDRKALTRSRFVGVAPTSAGRWCATLHHEKKRHYMGVFDTEETAAAAYDKKALSLRGRYLRLNFDPVTHEERCGEWFDRSRHADRAEMRPIGSRSAPARRKRGRVSGSS